MSDDKNQANEDERDADQGGEDCEQDSGGGSDSGGQSSSQSGGQTSGFSQDPPASLFEWAVRLLSLLLVGGLTGYVVWQAFQPAKPTSFEQEVLRDEIRQEGSSWVVPFKITNQGTASLEALDVTLELKDPSGTVVEEESISFPLIGQQETVNAELWFDSDPRLYEIAFNVTGYRLP